MRFLVGVRCRHVGYSFGNFARSTHVSTAIPRTRDPRTEYTFLVNLCWSIAGWLWSVAFGSIGPHPESELLQGALDLTYRPRTPHRKLDPGSILTNPVAESPAKCRRKSPIMLCCWLQTASQSPKHADRWRWVSVPWVWLGFWAGFLVLDEWQLYHFHRLGGTDMVDATIQMQISSAQQITTLTVAFPHGPLLILRGVSDVR